MTADAPDDVHAARTAARHSASVRLGRKLLPSRCGVRLPRETYKSIRRVIQTRFVHWPRYQRADNVVHDAENRCPSSAGMIIWPGGCP